MFVLCCKNICLFQWCFFSFQSSVVIIQIKAPIYCMPTDNVLHNVMLFAKADTPGGAFRAWDNELDDPGFSCSA